MVWQAHLSLHFMQEWIISKTSSDDQYGYAEYLNLDVLEKVINTLEKLTGHGDTVTLVSCCSLDI